MDLVAGLLSTLAPLANRPRVGDEQEPTCCLALVKFPKLTALPRVAIVVNSILPIERDPKPLPLFPPPVTPLVEEEQEPL